ncbi:MAG: N-acetylmuramoyl-L-alanine amidase [Planctomycetes bacterium]|nr:N-acetylmuramoyl-L-alanine amidase [Planctomycetota bacterium]MCB9936534.1 N-acetylmuramoyl-L-alanine amidase [Planctomycetota bacterium]
MRMKLITFAALALFMAGCTTIGTIPPTPVTADNPEPRTIWLSEMAAELGWTYVEGPGAYDYTLSGPKGDNVVFEAGSDIININGTQWRQERDAFGRRRDLMLPESTFNFVCEHFGRYDLVRAPKRETSPDYVLEPIRPLSEDKPSDKPKATSTVLQGLTICIDAGHGGTDPGGIGHGVQEKDVVLPVSLMLQELCEAASARVIMTRTSDMYPELDKRCEIANNGKCDLFISIHANISPTDESVTGIEVFYNQNSEPAALFAKALAGSLHTATGAVNRGAKKDPRGLRVLEKTKMTATLVELGFLSNAQEAKLLSQKQYQQKLAKALYDGVVATWTRNRASVSK